MMRKTKIKLSILFCLIVFLFTSTSITLATALNVENENLVAFENLSYSLFGDVEIESSELLYSLEDSPDFVYVAFEGNGYAVFYRDSMEMLEYSMVGSLPYPTNEGRKYYAGPSNYFVKEDDCYINTNTRSLRLRRDQLQQRIFRMRNIF